MARINLGREKGPTPTGSAQFGGVSSAGYGQLIRGYERLQAANDSVARGISHVSTNYLRPMKIRRLSETGRKFSRAERPNLSLQANKTG